MLLEISIDYTHYQRIEFLGDAVLEYITSIHLYLGLQPSKGIDDVIMTHWQATRLRHYTLFSVRCTFMHSSHFFFAFLLFQREI